MKNMADLQKMMKMAQDMQEKLRRDMAEMTVEGSSGGGMVTLTMNGEKAVLSLKIDPEVVDREDVGMLEDLITAAFRDASSKVDERLSEKMGGLGAGLKIPGLF